MDIHNLHTNSKSTSLKILFSNMRYL